jgi:hypothetical protein
MDGRGGIEMSDRLEDFLNAGNGGWQVPANNITWPTGATTGTTRIVAGAETPSELNAYGISVAVLFYVQDSPTGVEVGYFFIGLSNVIDDGNDNALLYGQVVYPTPGDPSSATAANVKTNFQQGMNDPGTSGNQSTRFKDFNVVVDSSVPFFQNAAQQSIIYKPTTMLADADVLYTGWPIGARKFKYKTVTQDYVSTVSTSNFDADLYWDDLEPGRYHIEFHMIVFGGAVGDIRTLYDFGGVSSGRRMAMGPTPTAGTFVSRTDTNMQTLDVAFATPVVYSTNSPFGTYVYEVIDVFCTGPATLYLKHSQAVSDPTNTGLVVGSKTICERYE